MGSRETADQANSAQCYNVWRWCGCWCQCSTTKSAPEGTPDPADGIAGQAARGLVWDQEDGLCPRLTYGRRAAREEPTLQHDRGLCQCSNYFPTEQQVTTDVCLC